MALSCGRFQQKKYLGSNVTTAVKAPSAAGKYILESYTCYPLKVHKKVQSCTIGGWLIRTWHFGLDVSFASSIVKILRLVA